MAELPSLSFNDADISAILASAPLLQDVNIPDSIIQSDDWQKLNDLKKEQIRTVLHGLIMTEYLRSNIAPKGLIVNTAPYIFLHDMVFRLDWSKISWHCTRDWIVLIIKTATRLSDALLIQIQTLESQIKSMGIPAIFKKKLEELNQNITEFKDYLLQSKIKKLKKDVKNFTLEKLHPYTSKDYVISITSTGSQDSDSVSSEGSTGSSDSYRAQGYSKNRGRFRGPRFYHNQQPLNPGFMPYSHMVPPPFFQPYQAPPPMWGIPPHNVPFQRPFFEPQQPFLGRGQHFQRTRRREGRKVHWETNLDQQQGPITRSKSKEPEAGPSRPAL